MSLFAVFGSPIAHSLSPIIHQAFGNELGISLQYERINAPLGTLAESLEQFRMRGGVGANITVPLKLEAYTLCSEHTDNAKKAMAVNTLYWSHNTLCGDNTDGEGLVRDLTLNIKLNLEGKRLLILGAGGATRGILAPLLAQSVETISIANRTLENARILSHQDPRITAYNYELLNNSKESPFDLIINSTSASLEDKLLPLALKWVKGAVVMDLVYKKQETVFMQWAKSHGALATHDGIGMLVEQAALSFKRWHQVLPSTGPVIQMLKAM